MKARLARLLPREASREVSALVLLLALAALAVTGHSAFEAWRSLAVSGRIAEVNRQAAPLFRAVEGIQLERGRTQNALRAEAPATAAQLGQIIAPREAARDAAGPALEGLAAVGGAALAARVAEARRALAALDAARAAVDSALLLPLARRPEALIRDWYGIASAAVAALNAVWLEASAVNVAGGDALLARISETAYLAHQAREDAGVERAGLSVLVARPEAIGPERLSALAMRRGAVAFALRRIAELNPPEAADPAVTAALAAMREAYQERFGSMRERILATAAAGLAAPLPLAEWQALGDRGLASILGVRDAALAQAERHLAARQQAALQSLLIEAGIVAVVLGIALLVHLRLSRRLLAPLAGITAALAQIGRGETRPVLPPLWREDDEIGLIARAVRDLAGQMAHRAEAEAERRAAAARQAERVARLEALVAAFEADAVHALVSVDRAAASLEETAAALEGAAREGVGLTGAVAGAADATASNTQVAAAAAEELTASVAEIARQVTQATGIARRAVAEAQRTDETMQGLSAAAERIGEVVQMISGIAAQTNLLALNATIEAARAGEAGKGFAVVASEVKSLAGQTAKATADIAEQIAHMRSVALSAVETVRGIGAVVAEIHEAAAAIAAAVEEQGAATAEIARSVGDVARSTGSVSTDTRAASAAARRTGEISREVRGASRSFAEEAARMRARIADFLRGVRAA